MTAQECPDTSFCRPFQDKASPIKIAQTAVEVIRRLALSSPLIFKAKERNKHSKAKASTQSNIKWNGQSQVIVTALPAL